MPGPRRQPVKPGGGIVPRGMMPVSDCNKKSMTVRFGATRMGMESPRSTLPVTARGNFTVQAGPARAALSFTASRVRSR